MTEERKLKEEVEKLYQALEILKEGLSLTNKTKNGNENFVEMTAEELQWVLMNSTYIQLRDVLIKLNSILRKPISTINVISVAKEKVFIDTKEFELLYGFSRDKQKELRGRVNNPLPYIQTKAKGDINYKKKEVDKWLENFKKV